MTAFPDLTPIPNRLTRPDTIDDDADSFFPKLPTWAQAAIEMAAGMGATASGAAFSIPYKFLTSALLNGSAAGGIISFNATQILVDVKSSAGAIVTNALAAAGASSSTIKSYLRITNASDATKWATYSVSAYALNAGGLYGVFNVTLVDRTSSTPFANNDPVVLSITPNGDKGDTGPVTTNPLLHIREEQASNTAAFAGISVATSTYRRVLNTVKTNTISGTNLASNQITLPAGTYDIRARAPLAVTGSAHRSSIYNVTDAAELLLGSPGYSQADSGATARASWSEIWGRVTLASAKTIELRSYSGGTYTWGDVMADSRTQVYSEIWIEKVG